MPKTSKNREAIAIVSMGAIFPGRGDTTGFWRDIMDGVDAFGDVPETHWRLEDYYDADPEAPDRTYGRRGAFLSPTAFDPVAFGVPPAALQSTDTSQLLALVAAQQVMDEAERQSAGKIDRNRTSVILGVASATELTAHMAGRLQRPAWVKGMREAGLSELQIEDIAERISSNFAEWRESTFPGLLGNVIAGRIANRLDLGGSNYVTDAACASSLSAVQIALHELRSGDSDMVLTGGVDTLNDILMFMCFSKTPALSPSGACRPFSAHADGTMLGEGIGMLALRRLEDAERDGQTIHAVIRGLGGASDGRATAIYAPLATGQAKALKRAYDQAGYSPATVELVEAHGTGTIAGDKAELEGLHTVFRPEDRPKKAPGGPWCALGSVKSQIGHTKAAAGSASLIKVVNALSRKILPPTVNVGEPAKAVQDSPAFYLTPRPRPWIRSKSHPRRASVSSFGFGGSNFHVTLEEYTGGNAARPPRALASELMTLSSKSVPDLLALLDDLSAGLTDADSLARAASDSHVAFSPDDPHRVAIVASDPADFRAKLGKLKSQLADDGAARPLGPDIHYAAGKAKPSPVAFLFAGQGSQYVGMGAGLALAFPAARAIWDKAADHKALSTAPLHDLAFPPIAFSEAEASHQSERLTAMEHAQPAIAAVALAQLALLDRLGLRADICAGHSFGEVMALHYAGVFKAADALTVARKRGLAMAAAAGARKGAMLAVQASAAEIKPVLDALGGEVTLANDNAPNQVALSGTIDAIARAEALCGQTGIKARRLPVATAFHSTIVEAAAEPFAGDLEGLSFSAPQLDVVANTTAKVYPKTPSKVRARLVKQIAAPVLFRQSLEAMYASGARTFIEIGPGSVLSTLARHTLADRPVTLLSLDHKKTDDVTAFLRAVGALQVGGHRLDLAGLFDGLPAPTAPPETPKFAVEIIGSNYDKPYPKPGERAQPTSLQASSSQTPKTSGTSLASPTSSRTEDMTQPTPEKNIHARTSSPLTPADNIAANLRDMHGEFIRQMSATHTAFLQAMVDLAGSQGKGVPQAPRLQNKPAADPAIALAPAPIGPTSTGTAPTAYVNGVDAGQELFEANPTPGELNGHAAEAMPAMPFTASAMPAPAATQTPAPAAPTDNPLIMVTQLVAEKTGYPSEMLDADMDLEGELGVDSIKQVEILSALRERRPDLPEVAPEKLAELRTIRLIADFICGGAMSSPPIVESPAVAAPAPAALAAASLPTPPQGNGVNAETIRMLIAEKTGYPSEMLEDDMDLEGELGIDSIKQVEILSALREQAPGLPEIEAEQLSEMRTIRKIADFFQ